MELDELMKKLCETFPEMSFAFERDNYGQIVIYTGMVEVEGELLPMEEGS